MPLPERVVHPLVDHHLATVRSSETTPQAFRESIQCIAMVLGVQATCRLGTREVEITTPLCPTRGRRLADSIAIVPILRAGLGLVEPLLQMLPDAQVWHLGLYRDEETTRPVSYYDRLPTDRSVDTALVLDPMLATGGSAILALERLRAWGVRDLRVLSVIAARPGLQRVQQEFPDAQFFVAAIDPELNEQAFIVPGLGDAGDRIFNTG